MSTGARGMWTLVALVGITAAFPSVRAQDTVPRDERTASPVPDSLDGTAYLSLQGQSVTVYFVEGHAALAERMRSLLDGQPPLPALPDTIPSGVHAVLAHTPAALDEITGGAVPEWRAGVAIPSLNMLVIPAGEGAGVLSGEGLRTLRHEWAHLALDQYLGGLRIPRWFNEGYAEWASSGFDAMGAWRLRVGLALGRTPSMDSLALGWPTGREEARTAYLLAASAVTYLTEGSGERGLAIFLERWRTQGAFEPALRETYGVTSGQFEEDWRAHVKARYGWLFVLGHSSVFWLVLSLALFYMVRVRRIHNEEKLARLRAQELPDLPAYWTYPDEEPPSPPGG
ncbi:MAG: hypothetical protein WD995_07485 [Gemmatimonadota bacterium]